MNYLKEPLTQTSIVYVYSTLDTSKFFIFSEATGSIGSKKIKRTFYFKAKPPRNFFLEGFLLSKNV